MELANDKKNFISGKKYFIKVTVWFTGILRHDVVNKIVYPKHLITCVSYPHDLQKEMFGRMMSFSYFFM